MRTFMFLFIMGLIYNQAPAQGNSTQVYYTILTVEESAIDNITKILETFSASNSAMRVDGLKMTTKCQTLEDELNCTCEKDHRWSTEVCESYPKCCGERICAFPDKTPQMCYTNKRVVITGSCTLHKRKYFDSMKDSNSDKFKELSKELLREMKPVYSTLKEFDTLKIKELRRGSVIAIFEITLNSDVSSDELARKSEELQTKLNATFTLETAGRVQMYMPPDPVSVYGTTKINCSVDEDMDGMPQWNLTKMTKTYNIAKGTESALTSTTRSATLALTNPSAIWEGLLTCIFKPINSSVAIFHSASKTLDIALLPEIDIISDPQFPHCIEDSTEEVKVAVKCEIKNNSETYDVHWGGSGNKTELNLKVYEDEDRVTYVAETKVGCETPDQKDPAKITCTFSNGGQSKDASLKIEVIYFHSIYCEKEGDWPNTKANHTARLRCQEGRGERFRQCENVTTEHARWKDELSQCVNVDLYSILEDTSILDKGLGSLDENAGDLFVRLKNSTTDTEKINTYANVNASVRILFNMRNLQTELPDYTYKETVLDALVESASNILSDSLETSWKEDQHNQDINKENQSMAERYLHSVEGLINATNITNVNVSKTNVELVACRSTQESHCTNTVLNVTVSVENSGSSPVKTAGFRRLGEYLPSKNQQREINSLVVSTTVDNNPSPKVKIDFHLIKERPRNMEIECVSWSESERQWTKDGCTWGGPENEAHCDCVHLSSFAILMSKYPQEVPFIDEITYVGLALSIISLVTCLGIELVVWNDVTTTKSSSLRHTALVNIYLCLLIADCGFLASSFPDKIPENWCQIFVVVKHFCFLSMFFWMLCLSFILLHQTYFQFHQLTKRKYMGISFFLGYACPFLIVAITFITNSSGAKGLYYASETCWLIYSGLMKGTVHTFILPVGIIVMFNMFTMVLVILKLLESPKGLTSSLHAEKAATKHILRTVIILTPIIGTTWIFGFAVWVVDLTHGLIAYIVNYAFTLLNAFQGLFILLTTCLADKAIRDALTKRGNAQNLSQNTKNPMKLKSASKKK